VRKRQLRMVLERSPHVPQVGCAVDQREDQLRQAAGGKQQRTIHMRQCRVLELPGCLAACLPAELGRHDPALTNRTVVITPSVGGSQSYSSRSQLIS
jgi:hypothetical protein